jgi:hypothetical protein
MGISASTGPIIAFGQGAVSGDYNGQRGPSVFDQFLALMDPRTPFQYQPGQSESNPVAGWMSGGQYVTLDCVPLTLGAANIAASQSPGAGAIVLTAAAGVTGGLSVVNAVTGATVTGLLGLDGGGGRLSFGQTGTVQLWDPAKSFGRTISITSGGNDSALTFTVNGFDVYGQPMTENITGASGAAATGLKAFKYISSVTHTGSIASTVTVGTTDVIGFPLLSQFQFPHTVIAYNGAMITAATGYLAGVATSPATAITGDPRGTYALQSASNGVKRLTVLQTITPANISSIAGLLGVTHFTL